MFEHALRVRMKSDSPQSSLVTRPQTEPSTPDTASIAESTVVEGTSETATSSPTIQPSTPPSDGGTTKKGKKPRAKDGEEEKATEKGSNLVGKITNLVSTDLNNIVDGRDFPMLLISLPLHVVFCVMFLYRILGWSAIVGTVVMFALYPLPGWIASKMQSVQQEKMKIVSHGFPLISSDFVSFHFFVVVDGCACSGCF